VRANPEVSSAYLGDAVEAASASASASGVDHA